MDATTIAQISALMEANTEKIMKQSKAMMQEVTQENNATMLDAIGKATDENVGMGVDALRQEIAPQIATMAEQIAKLVAAQTTPAPQLDPWQAGRAAAAARAMAVDVSGSSDPSGSAAARATSNKRRFVAKDGPNQVDRRNQRNPLRLHLKGFDRKVPPRSIGPCGTRSWWRLATSWKELVSE